MAFTKFLIIHDTENFILEKSLDGTNFKSIQTITPYTLNAQDNSPDYGVNYYRIKQQFLNGESRYSPIREEVYYLDEQSITIFPNPATSVVNVSIGHFSDLEGEVISQSQGDFGRRRAVFQEAL